MVVEEDDEEMTEEEDEEITEEEELEELDGITKFHSSSSVGT